MEKYEGLSDEEIIRLAKGGDAEAMDCLLAKYKGLVLKLCRARFLAGGEKDDLIQEGMIGLYKAVRDFVPGGDAKFMTFAALCIDRQILRAIEASQRDKNKVLNNSISLSGKEWELAEQSALMNQAVMSPESIVLEQSAAYERLKTLKEKLSPLEREVLDLYLAGHGYREIAAILKKSPKSIDNAFQRIRKKSRSRDA